MAMASARPYSVINLHSTILLQVYARASKSIAFYEVNPREQFKSTQAFNSEYRFASQISSAVDKVLCFETCVWWWLWWQEYNSFIPPTNISSLCVSVHLTVHPSQFGVLLTQLNLGSCKECRMVPQGLISWRQRSRRNSKVVTPKGAANAGGIG